MIKELREFTHRDTVFGYVDFLYQFHQRLGEQIFFGTETGGMRDKYGLYKIFLRDGSVEAYGSWTQFCHVLLEYGEKNVDVNTDKTKTWLKNEYKTMLDGKEIYVTYTKYVDIEDESVVESPNVEEQQEETLSDVVEKPCIDTIKAAAKEMKANKFKKWLKEYLLTFPTFSYKIVVTNGVSKIINEVEEKLNAK